MSKAKQGRAGQKSADLKDSAEDRQKLKNEEFTIDLPDVEDIPGQEHVHPPNPAEFADTTISSADEEGENIWGKDLDANANTNVSKTEKKLLHDSANDMPTNDEQGLRESALDDTDQEGEALNEGSSSNSISGSDLDIPGADEDDHDEEIGEEDEENNSYSLGGDNNSINEEQRD